MNKHLLITIFICCCLLISCRPGVQPNLNPVVGDGSFPSGIPSELTGSPQTVVGAGTIITEPEDKSLVPASSQAVEALVFGMLLDLDGVFSTAEQVEQLAGYLEDSLETPVRSQVFNSSAALAEWVKNYRVADLVALRFETSEPGLGREYPAGVLPPESSDMVVVRRGFVEDIQSRVQMALLDMPQTDAGRSLLASLGIRQLVPLGSSRRQDMPRVEAPLAVVAAELVSKEEVLSVEPELPVAVTSEIVESTPEPVASLLPDVVSIPPLVDTAMIVPQEPEVPVAFEPTQVVADEVVTLEATTPDDLSLSEPAPAESTEPVAEDVIASDNIPVSDASVDADGAVLEEQAEDQSAYFSEMLGEDSVASAISQPDIPQNLRPPGVPILRPGRLPKKPTFEDNERLLSSIPKPMQPTRRPQPPRLLPEPEPEAGVIYIVPFVSVMVPREVDSLIFDRFVDNLNARGESLGLQFVILKEGLRKVGPDWLAARKYVTGEIYAYVEDSGCCNTDMRAKARLTYFRSNQEEPEFRFEYPVKAFFDHDRSTIEEERIKLAESIATILATELLKAIQH